MLLAERKKPAGAFAPAGFSNPLIQAVNSSHTDSPACSSHDDGAGENGGESASV